MTSFRIIALILLQVLIKTYLAANVYVNKDVNPNIARMIQKELFVKKEFVYLRAVLQSCLWSVTLREKEMYRYSLKRILSCFRHQFKAKILKYFKLIGRQRQKILLNNIMGNVYLAAHHSYGSIMWNSVMHLKFGLHNTAMRIKILLPEQFRVQLAIRYFRLPYQEDCGHGWMAYQDSDTRGQNTPHVNGINTKCHTRHNAHIFQQYMDDCLGNEFPYDGTIYGRYCGSLKPWMFYSTGWYVLIMYRFWNYQRDDSPYDKINLFCQPFSTTNDTNVVLSSYTFSGTYTGTLSFGFQDYIFEIFHVYVQPGYVVRLQGNVPLQYFDGPSSSNPKLLASANGLVLSTGHTMTVLLYKQLDNKYRNINHNISYGSIFNSVFEIHNVTTPEVKHILINTNNTNNTNTLIYNLNSLSTNYFISLSLSNLSFLHMIPSMMQDTHGVVLFEQLNDGKTLWKSLDNQINVIDEPTSLTLGQGVFVVLYSYKVLDVFENTSITVSLSECPGIVFSPLAFKQIEDLYVQKKYDKEDDIYILNKEYRDNVFY